MATAKTKDTPAVSDEPQLDADLAAVKVEAEAESKTVQVLPGATAVRVDN